MGKTRGCGACPVARALRASIQRNETRLGEDLGDRHVMRLAGERVKIKELGLVDQGEDSRTGTGVGEGAIVIALAVPEASA